jgi:hypothetical protein
MLLGTLLFGEEVSRQSRLIDVDRVPGRIRYAHEYETHLGEGVVQVYQGHPCHCAKSQRHDGHLFRYSYRLRDGSIVNGKYWCDGWERKEFPKRWIDMTPEEQVEFERQRDVPRKKHT